MLEKIAQGYDLASGWRAHRQVTGLTRTLPSQMANGLLSWVTGVHLHDYACTLKAYRREVITSFHFYGEMHRFIPQPANWIPGCCQTAANGRQRAGENLRLYLSMTAS